MSSESPPAKKPRNRPAARPSGAGSPPIAPAARLFDALLLLSFLALTFLLGAFPLKDTDFWWHLRTGDLIRQTGVIPKVDTYTYTVAGKPWIDLHWVFQVAISFLYEWGGFRALNLAKCGVTTLAVFLLITARRREWPVWAAVTAWLPALLVLGGRMYVRPETLTLLYLSIFLAVLVRIERWPWLALVLPPVQVAWVNTQGLFVLGLVLLGAALVDALLRPGSLAKGRRRWWRIVGVSTVMTGLACFCNPYGFAGALYPLELARTMSNPTFVDTIEELKPIPKFIQGYGLASLPFRLHLLTLAVGALSFLVPMTWVVMARLRPVPAPPSGKAGPPAKVEKTAKRAPRATKPKPESRFGWHLSPFRLLLFAAFSLLSWRATRNSHQFAAVVGSVTAWNLAEWAAAVARRRRELDGAASKPGSGWLPRLAALGAVAAVLGWVASGSFYEAAREGRTIGLGEQPLWYPHDAVRFCGTPGMPEKFLGFHIGHPSLYEYHFAPDRKVFADARLEVMGPELYERYMDLHRRLGEGAPGWSRELDEIGRPIVLVDLEGNAAIAATLMNSPDWRCVWLDAVAAVFVHVSFREVVESHAVDFAARHFRPEPAFEPRGAEALLASAKGLRNLASFAGQSAPGRVAPIALLGMDHARRAAQAAPDRAEPWKLLGLFETLREPMPTAPVPRFRMAFDPVFDLSAVRTTYALNRALEVSPDDFLALLMLVESYNSRGMGEAALPWLDRLLALEPINRHQDEQQARLAALRGAIAASLGPPPPERWDNLVQLNRIAADLLAKGRAATAANLLSKAAPGPVRTWDEADRIATLRLHLGQPAEARATWQGVANPPRPALRDARVAVTHLVEGDFEAARSRYKAAIEADSTLFEASYGLAVLEQDAGRAADALTAARRAVELAPSDVARSAAQGIVALVTPYATSRIAGR